MQGSPSEFHGGTSGFPYHRPICILLIPFYKGQNGWSQMSFIWRIMGTRIRNSEVGTPKWKMSSKSNSPVANYNHGDCLHEQH